MVSSSAIETSIGNLPVGQPITISSIYTHVEKQTNPIGADWEPVEDPSWKHKVRAILERQKKAGQILNPSKGVYVR